MHPTNATPPFQNPPNGSDSDEQKIFDKTYLLKRIDYDQDLFKQLCDLFREQMPEALQNLRQAIQNQDHAQIAFFAHLIKGQCGNMGAFNLQEVAATIERLAKQNSAFESIKDLLPVLETAYVGVEHAL